MSSTSDSTYSCFFPAVCTAGNAQKRPLSVRVDLQQLALVQQLLSEGDNHASLVAAVKVTWALLLRTYTGLDRICYSYEEVGGASVSSVGEQDVSNGVVDPVVMLDMDEDTTPQQLLEKVETDAPSEKRKCEYNTSVLCRFGAQMGKTHAPGKTMAMRGTCNLRLLVKVLKTGISMFLEYRTSFLPTEQARNIASTVDAILTAVLSLPKQSLREADFFSQRNRLQVESWNSGPLDHVQRTIHDVIAETALRAPNEEAVCSWDGSLSYQCLYEHASRVAQHLIGLGVGAEVVVPLCFDKEKWNVVAVLAVLLAGGCFLPLDPAAPKERAQHLIHAVGAKVLLCSRTHSSSFSELIPNVLSIDDDFVNSLPLPPQPIQNRANSTNAAYIIPTSGTTGQPKLTLVEHGNFCTGANGHFPGLGMDVAQPPRCLQFAAHSFDASIIEILTPLMYSGTVCIPDETTRLNDIAKAINDMRVTYAQLTPTFVRFLEPSMVPNLVTIVLMGESMSQANLDTWSQINLVNGYGPSECSVASLGRTHMTAASDPRNIGLPISCHAWVVDPNNRHVRLPIGCTGELLIEGHIAARGYLHDEEKTAQAFVTDVAWAADRPFRGYLTGDLVFQNPDGTFNIVGRKDNQVKYHGQRIELLEIEHHLNLEAEIKHNLVLLPKDGPCKERLVAVISLTKHTADDEPLCLFDGQEKAVIHSEIEAIRSRVSERLPFFMLPTVWIACQALPRLSSGKLDRKRVTQWLTSMPTDVYQRAIPAAEESRLTHEPTDDVEKALRSIWAHVLNLSESQVALDRPFLSLGGDSISAMQVMGQSRKRGLGLGVQDILRSRSIPQLAAAVKTVQSAIDNTEEVEKPFDLTPIQSLWFQLPNQGHGHFNQSFYLKVNRKTSADEFHGAVKTLVSRHSMLRARFSVSEGRGWQQRVTEDTTHSYRFRHQTVSTKNEIDAMIADSQTCLDHGSGPLLAADLFEFGNEQHAFLVAHHLVIDLVTWRLLLEELEEILKGEDLLPPALPFQTWAHLQSEHAKTLKLHDVLPSVEIPAMDFSYWGIQHADNTYGNAGHGSFELDPSLTSKLLTDCHTAFKTETVEVLLASLIQSWSHVFTDRPVPAIFNEGHGREPWTSDIDISRTVGWFTTLYPVYVEPSRDPAETVRKVKDFRRRIPDNGRPYFASRQLTAEGLDQFKSHWPMEISFNYLGQYQQLERSDALLQPLESMAGETREAGGTADVGSKAPRFGLFEISAIVFKGRLKFAFTFNRHMQHQDRIQQWVSQCSQSLTEMVIKLPTLAPTPTLSDFPLLSLDEERFQSMLQRLSKIGIAPTNIEYAYPTSNMQEGLLLSQTKDAGFYAAVTQHELKLANSQPSSQQLADAWRLVVNRHPALRTIFLENIGSDEGLYDQVVLSQVEPNIGHFECNSEHEALEIFARQRFVSYDNGRNPPHRFSICSTSNGRVFCCLEISHAIMDGHSMSVLFDDLRKAYEGRLREDGPAYSDYISYLMKLPQESSLDFWKSYLSGSEVCSFPILNDGQVVEKQLNNIRVDFGSLSILDLQNFCSSNGITLSNIFHTAWALTLSRYIGTNDVTFGYLTSARDSQDIPRVEEMVGPLINTLVCRVKLADGTQCLMNILQDVQKDYMDSIPHRHIALAEVQHSLDLSGANLFNTALSYRRLPSETPSDDVSTGFVEIAPIYDPTEYPVSINIEVSDDLAMVDLDYWTDHLSDGQANNVASAFVRALENIIHHSDLPLASLDHLSGKHWQQIQDWNIMPETLHECVHHRFESWVESQPDAPAVRGFDGDYTYAELDAITNRLANHLVDLGIGPEVFVPTCFDKSSFAVIAMLAVLKAGGAAVPLDANHPKPALESRVEDTQAQVVLTTQARSEMFEDVVPDVVIVDSVLLEDLEDVDGPVCTSVGPQNPAFVIFTSGSTGRPKGVVLEHAAMVSSAAAHGKNLGIGPGSRFLQFASYTFDNSLEEMFTSLQRGACVCVPSEDQRMNNLAGAIAELGANFMDLTPTVAALLNPSDVPTIRGMALGGEALTKAVVEQWSPHVHLHGQYGPSEASINSAWKDFKHGGEPTNIGRAIGSVSWIVDADNRDRLVPIGCKGELLIEGPILSRGYLNDPEKTKLAFIDAPEWARNSHEGRRFYCTGDLVYYNSDGEMMYLGRKDSQVKLNGQRIELGEIEHHLKLNLPADAQSAVELVKFKDSKGTKALVAFLCLYDEPAGSVNDRPPAIGELSETVKTVAKQMEVALAESLPAYYVPSLFMPVTSMPMTTSGKLDRKVLRKLAESVPEDQLQLYRLAGKSGRAPSGHVETTLARLWSSVLGLAVDAVGADDSFFRLGGDSIGAMKLVTASRKEGMVLNVANIFAEPKLKDMAATAVVLSLDELTAAAEPDTTPFELVPGEVKRRLIDFAAAECGVFPDSVEDIYPCSRLQEGLIALSTKEPGSYVAEAIYRLPPDVDIARFKHAWGQVIASEAILRTRILYTEECGFVQVVVRDQPEWHHLADVRDINETHRHLPAKHGSVLTSYAIVGEATSSPLFVFTMHHAVYDGWSLPNLLCKVESCYRQVKPEALVSVPYSRFIKYLSSIDGKKSDEFWLAAFDNLTAPQFPQLPTPDYNVQASSQLLHRVEISRRSGVDITMPSMIRAAWGLVLATYSGSDDVLWGETNSGREVPVPGIEDVVGATIATSPMRLKLNRRLTITEYLQEVQRQASAALPYQFAGLQHIRKLSSDTAAACDFQSLLAIVAGDSMKDPEGGLWNLQSTGTIGTNFFNYALIFNCSVEKESVHIEAHYDGQVIQPWLVEHLVNQFDFILTRFNTDDMAKQTLAEMELLNAADQEVIGDWNSRPVNIINKCIHNAIYQDQVILRPAAIAIDAWDTGAMTYRELDERATRLASQLISLGVKPQSFVPICFDKSGWTIVSMLAIMKCGAAFVPLDFEAPILRLREIVGDVKAELILCSPQYEQMCQSIPCSTLAVDRDMTERQPGGRLNTLPYVQSNTPAYVIFTSGSTGKPKGAVINHCSWVSSSTAFAPQFRMSETSRVLQFASYTFDACLIEILSTLMVGGTIIVPDQASRTNDLAGVINSFNVNWATLTPSVVRTMQPSQVPKLQTLILVGEAMSQQDLLTWADRVTLGNGYGPTECSAIATVNIMTSTTKPNNLGKAVTARGWVVSRDNHDILAPLGAIGELVLEDGGVGAGYLNNPEKTAQAFLDGVKWTMGADTHDQSKPRRFYKTGDLVKYNEDGTLLYLGRKDSQTKVRGQRLELSEVEHHLIEDALVQNALAAVPTSGPCAKRLVGVVALQNVASAPQGDLQLLPKDTASLNIGTIRDRVCERLPSYMVPSLWVAVSKFPLMPSGKMDRRRVVQWLERMDTETYRIVSTLGLEAPKEEASASDGIESKLQAIFSKTLNLPLEDIRLNQSFLHLGGDSIAAMQVSSQCRAQGLAITVQDIIRSKSIAALASKASVAGNDSSAATNTKDYELPFDLTPIQRVFMDMAGDTYNHFNQSVVLRLSRSFELHEVKAALVALCKIHPMLRGRYAKDESSIWRQRIDKNVENSFRLRQHQVSTAKDATMRPIIDESQATLDITQGPTFAVELFEIDDTFSQAIALVAHHLVVDVVSWGIILEDLQSLLVGVQPPPQSLPFHAWSEQQIAQAKQDTARKVLPITSIPPADYEYWGMSSQCNINADVIIEEIELSPKDSMLLLGAHDALATEPLDVFIAALLQSFRKVFPDRSTATIHNEGHGREPFNPKQDLSRTVGWFTTLTPIPLPVPNDEPTDIVSTIRWVKDVRDRVPDKGRPYFAYRLLAEEGQERFSGHWPAEVTFNYLGRMQNLERKDALLQRLDGVSSMDVGDDVPRLSLFEVTALVAQGTIKLSFAYNRHMKRQVEIKQWISETRQTLVDAVDQLLQLRPEPSLSDFKLLPLSYNGVTRLNAVLPSGTTIADIEDIYPTSPLQSGILLAQQKQPEFYAYHCIFEVRSTNPGLAVNPRKIAEAWQIVVHRHPALRTVFIESLSKSGLMEQIVFKDKPARITWMADCDDDDIAGFLREQPAVDYRDFSPPHRLTVCKTKTDRVWLKLEMSHAICDGSSIPNILNDMARAYEGKLSRADTGPLFSDFIAHILASSRDVDVNYWKSYLSGVEPCFFPTLTDGKPGPHELGAYEVHIADTASIQAFCKRNGVTLSNVLQLTWALVLHCFVGASDVSFGVVASGRDVPVRNIEEAAGCFVNMLICRLNFTDETPLRQLLEALQTDSVNALSHQSCSLADVQHELQLPSLFNTVFTYQRRQLSRDPEKTALVYENVEAADPGEYHVTVNADVSEDGTTVDFGFWKDRICPAQAQNMVETFEKILSGIVASEKGVTVGELDVFTPGSLQQVLEWNAELPPPVRRCLHDLVQEQALLRPRSAKAVEGWDGTFTYQEFDEVTNQLALHLQNAGVTTETFVPILFEKSSWAIVGMIAIMKAGGAYVPLDPKQPPARLRQLIGDVGANVVLCSRNHQARASEVASTALIIDRQSIDDMPLSRGRPKTDVTPDNAAYCLFTSGTTGTPKGTIITHEAICTSAAAFTRLMHMDATSRTFQFASYTFDASCAEILAALSVGACITVPTEDERMNDPAGAIRRLKATWTFMTPSVLGTMKPERVSCLKTLVAGGEAVPGPVITKWGTHVNLANGYGPTETTVFAVTCHKSSLDKKLIDVDPGTIGYASGCRLWVVHPRNHDKLMPVGSVGELVIEGYTAARGYLNDATKTAKVFIADPAWASTLPSETGEAFFTTRMYKSGDLVRYNSDGSISYIGRKDTQIKLNGQRIELGEIEFHVKSKFPEGFQSAVELVAPASRSSAKALAVFFSMDEDERAASSRTIPPSSSQPKADDLLLPMDEDLRDMCKSLENALGGVLPSYMIPGIFFPCRNMPWTTAGKLDRNRLRNLVQSLSKEEMAPYRLSSAMNKKKPTTTAEKKLLKLVCSVLNLSPSSVGVDDSFIRIGGDSIAAMRLVTAAQTEHLELSVIDIFKTPKLSDLAAKCNFVEKNAKPEQAIEPFSLLPQPLAQTQVLNELTEQCRVSKDAIQDAYPLSPLQEAFIALSIKQRGAYVAQHILALAGSVDLQKFKAAWDKAVQETDLLRTRIVQLQSGTFLQAVLAEDPIAWRETGTLKEAEDDATSIPQHLGAKLAAYTIVRTTANKRYFVWTLHHAVYDGWSIPFMLQRVQQIYQAGLSELSTTPYTKFIKYILDTSADASSAYWRETLAGAASYKFPQQLHSTSGQSPNGQTLQHTARIAHRHSDVTPSTVIRAAWALILAAYTQSDDVCFGETLTGRDIALSGITEICGPTLTTVPTRINMGSQRQATVADLLKGIAKSATDRIPHQHFGLSNIKRLDEDSAAACDFQNLLAIQTGGEQPSESMWSFHNNGIQANYFTYPLVIECTAGQSSFDVSAHYDANTISSWQVQRILYQLDHVLSQLNSVKNVRDIQVFSEQDKQLLTEWNVREPVAVEETIPSLFFKQAASRPQATAVSAFDGEFTYAELSELSSRLAQELVKLGAGPEDIVPLCVNKSRWAVVAIMGILISGAGYVPLSPEHPASRHRQIIADCNASIALCSPEYEQRFVSDVRKVIKVSETTIQQLPALQTRVPLRARSNNICYVLYTSGSTGVPKGVVIEHQAIASSAAAICKALHITSSSRVFQFGSFVFDASVMEILVSLTAGAAVCIPSEQERTADIASAINKLRATWTCLTPSVANVIESAADVPTLKTLASGAEALTPETIAKWSSIDLLNAYGPTEGSIVAVANDQVLTQRDPSVIGRALESGRAWLTNPENPHQLAPIGAVAELCIEGPLLARGYLNNRAKTAESFVEDPAFIKHFIGGAQTRLYRTGDLVQYASDGAIRYIGRKDNQVKLAGQRMELGEIEHHLQADKSVRQAVVQMPKSGPMKKKLVAVLSFNSIAPNAHAAWNTPLAQPEVLQQINDARSRLSDLVPSYMVPSIIVGLAHIPTLASSKLDRKQVGAWLEGLDDGTYQRILELESSSEPSAPVTEVVKKMQSIWAKALNVPLAQVKTNKSWLSLGGDSITAMQLLARCRKEGFQLDLNQVLRSKSLAHLTESVGSGNAINHGVAQTDKPFALSPIQQFYFNTLGDAKNSHFNQSFTLRLSQKTDPSKIKLATDAIVNAHAMLRARFSQTESKKWQQMIPSELNGAYDFTVQEVQSLSAVVELIADTQRSLNIVNGPMFAVDVFNVATGEQILFLTAHHLVVDVVSWGIILGDLEDCLKSGTSASLPRGLPFQVWNDKQIAHALDPTQMEIMQKQPYEAEAADLAFWGMDKRRNIYADIERDTFFVDKDITAMALNDHSILRTDVVDLMLAAIVHSFSRIFLNRKTPTVFNETHGREPWEFSNLDLSRTVGWLTAMYPVHVSIAEDEDDVVSTVRQVKDIRRRVIDNGRPYMANRYLTEAGKRRFAKHESMEIMFNYLGKTQQHDASDSLFKPMQFDEEAEAKMTDLGDKTGRPALFEISASVVRGEIQFTFMYNQFMKNQKGIRRWIAECQRTVEEIVTSLAAIENPRPTLSDFPLLPLESYERLDRVIKSLPAAGIVSYDQVEEMYPVAAMQSGMILSQIKDPASYWSFSTFEVKTKRGSVDVRKVADAWKKVVDRHPALRTIFVDSVCKGGTFDQIVVKNPDTGLLTYTCDDSELTKKLGSINYHNLNGKKKPRLPHQFTIVQTRSGRIIAKLEINHTIIDGSSYAIIRRDLEDAYEGRLSPDEGPLYSAYIKYLRGLPANVAINYWKEQLRGVKPCYFPIMPQHSSKQRELHSLYLDFDRLNEVQALAERSNVTFANVLLAAWALLLRTYTGSSDVCYGYLTSGRNVPIDDIQNAVGAFINMLVSRTKVSRSFTLLDIFQKVQSDFIESLPHQHCSLAQFQHDLGLSGKALFNTAVSVQNHGATETHSTQVSNIEFEPMDAHDPSEFAITVNINATRNDEGVRFSYWTDSVSDDEARNMSSIMAKILTSAIANANQTVGDLDAAIEDKPEELATPLPTPTIHSQIHSQMPSPRSEARDPMASLAPIPRIEAPHSAPAMPGGAPDWSNLIRNIVSEMVPQIVDQVLAKNKSAPAAAQATVNEMTNQMTSMIARRASQSMRGRPNLETGSIRSRRGSIRSRRLSAGSDAGSRIGIAADMLAVAATEAMKSAPPNFVEKKLLTLWSELLDMVEENIDNEDSFFQLGGDSIIAMRLVGAAREEGLSMTVADVFKNPTFADMTRVVRVAGEVIDQVMSQAGEPSNARDRSGSLTKGARPQLPERTASLWRDFQSIASEHAIGDGESDLPSPPAKSEQEKEDTMFKKWQGFGGDLQQQSPAPRLATQNRRMPTTIQEDPSANKSISLLGDPNVDSVISKVQVFKGGISDVLPVTDFQSLAITGTLLESKWMLNYFYLDGEGPLDLRKLKQTAFRMVQAFDILRTVFVPYGDRFLQVVLRKLQPDFSMTETDLDLDDFTTELRQRDREHGPRLGEQFVQFIVAKQKKTGHYRIFMRLSHAQYDGYCLPKILGALQAGYNGLPISNAPSFGNYVRESAKTVAGAHDHWSEVLRGSKMTEIVNRYGPNYQRSAGKTVTLEQRITVPSLRKLNITTATVMKAAWAATLARISNQADIVFGHVISGRNSTVPNIENIIGPCLNMVPVRVVYRPEWQVLDLLTYIQDQQTANMPYESLGFRDITRNCTDWPDWTNFSSVLQHNQAGIHSDDATLQLGGIEFKVGAIGSQEDFADFSIVSTSRGGDQVEVTLTYAPSSTITKDYAQNVFDMLCANAITFSEDPRTLLPSPSEITSQSSTTITSEKAGTKAAEKQPLTLPTNTSLSKHELNGLATTLRSAWEQILRDEHGAPAAVELGSDFFELGGDIMGLAQVSSILDHEGLRVRVEDLLDKSVFVDQVGVLAVERKKAIEKEEQSPWGEKGRAKKEEKAPAEKKGGMAGFARKMKLLKRDGREKSKN